MDSGFQVRDAPRAVPFDGLADLPLVTIVWRALHAEYQHRAAERKREESESRQMREVLAGIAEQVFHLRCAVSASTSDSVPVQHLSPITDRLAQLLAQLGMVIVAPEGSAYTDELMELFDNIAQQPDAAIREPRIAQVVAPAILYRGAVVQMGKAVIAVPSE